MSISVGAPALHPSHPTLDLRRTRVPNVTRCTIFPSDKSGFVNARLYALLSPGAPERKGRQMSFDAWLSAATVVLAFGLLAAGRWPPYLVLLGALLLLLVTGVLDVESALAGFSNPGLITVGVLFVVAAGLRQTGALAYFVRRALGRPKSVRSAQARLATPVMVGSAFLNNTPLVAMLLPVIQDWCRVARIPPSKVLLPLSYLAILGGVTTLVGTSTNLVVNGLLIARGEPSLGMFGITPVGLPCALIGMLFLLLLAGRLLPERGLSKQSAETQREYTVAVKVSPGGALEGKALEASGLLHLPGLSLRQLWRGEDVLEQPPADERLRAEDRLVFAGTLELILDVFRTPGLSPYTTQISKLTGHASERHFVEAVVSRTSPLLARTVREVGFRQLYGAVVLGVSRNGQRLNSPLEEIDFRPGDALLLDADRDFVEQHKNSGGFSLISRIHGEGPATSAQAPVAVAILLAMVVLVAFGWLDMLQAAALAAASMLLSRCCSEETARRAIDWPLLLAIGAAFGLGRALEDTGVAGAVSDSLLTLAGGNPWASLVVVYGTTSLLTEFVTNNAAAVIVFPIAFGTATALGVNHVPFVVAVMIAASSSFATPIGYQTNLMVYTAGGYRFSDFLRLGIPMNLLMWLVACLLAPLVFGF